MVAPSTTLLAHTEVAECRVVNDYTFREERTT
jgi:hypothetical protein